MNNLVIFTFGLLLGMIGIDLLLSLREILIAFLEIPKALINKKIVKENNIIYKLQEEQEPVSTQAIGFEIPNITEYEIDEEFEDKRKNKIGFN